MLIRGEKTNKGINLISAEDSDLSFFARLVNETDIRFFKNGRRPTMDEIEKIVNQEMVLIIEVEKVKNQEIINVGYCWLINIDQQNKTGTIGVLVGKQYQNYTFGLCSLEMLINHAFNIMGLRKISFSIYGRDNNTLNVAKGLGFIVSGLDPENPDFLDLKLLRPSWKGIRTKIENVSKIVDEL